MTHLINLATAHVGDFEEKGHKQGHKASSDHVHCMFTPIEDIQPLTCEHLQCSWEDSGRTDLGLLKGDKVQYENLDWAYTSIYLDGGYPCLIMFYQYCHKGFIVVVFLIQHFYLVSQLKYCEHMFCILL